MICRSRWWKIRRAPPAEAKVRRSKECSEWCASIWRPGRWTELGRLHFRPPVFVGGPPERIVADLSGFRCQRFRIFASVGFMDARFYRFLDLRISGFSFVCRSLENQIFRIVGFHSFADFQIFGFAKWDDFPIWRIFQNCGFLDFRILSFPEF